MTTQHLTLNPVAAIISPGAMASDLNPYAACGRRRRQA
jgi:hypothetical protein